MTQVTQCLLAMYSAGLIYHLLHNSARSEIEVLLHNCQQFLLCLLRGAIIKQRYREGLCHSNGIRHLWRDDCISTIHRTACSDSSRTCPCFTQPAFFTVFTTANQWTTSYPLHATFVQSILSLPCNLHVFSIQILYFLPVELNPNICAARTNKPANDTSWTYITDTEYAATCSACSPNTRIKNFMFMLNLFLANRKFHFRFFMLVTLCMFLHQYIIQQMHFVIQHETYLTATCLNNEVPSSGSYYSKYVQGVYR